MFLLRYLLVILFLSTSILAHGQTLQGNVKDKSTGAPLYPVTVVNLTTQATTYTNERGDFTIRAEAGQKVAFSFIGYKSKQYQMPISVGTYRTEIILEPTTYSLREVILMPDYTPYQKDSIQRIKTYRQTLSVPHASPIASPFSYVAEKFSRKSKQTFAFQKKYAELENERFIDTRYTPELVAEQTGLTGDSIGYFMNDYPMPYDYARTATEMEMKMWIRYNYRKWIENFDRNDIPQVADSLLNYD